MSENDRTSIRGSNMRRATQLANGESASYGLRLPTQIGFSKVSKLADFRVKETPIHLDQHKKDPAMLSVVNGGTTLYMTNRFYLTGVQEAREEKTQIIETFGVPSYSFFGEKTRIYNFSGQLLETLANTNLTKHPDKYLWSSSFLDLYENHLRGSKLAETGNEAVLVFKNTRLRGFILNVNVMHNATNPMLAQFSFSMIVRKQETINTNDGLATVRALYSTEAWVKTDALLKNLTVWHGQIGKAWEEMSIIDAEVQAELSTAVRDAQEAGTYHPDDAEFYRLGTVRDYVRDWSEDVIKNGIREKGHFKFWKAVNFSDLVSDDEAVVEAEANRVKEMISAVSNDTNYVFLGEMILAKYFGKEKEARSWKQVRDGGSIWSSWSTRWDLGHTWLTANTNLFLLVGVFNELVTIGPYAGQKDLMI